MQHLFAFTDTANSWGGSGSGTLGGIARTITVPTSSGNGSGVSVTATITVHTSSVHGSGDSVAGAGGLGP